MARKRSRRGIDKSVKRKPKKRIFIATEGVTEHIYFNKLKTELGAGNIDVLKSTSKTSPQQVLSRLAKYQPKDGDIRADDDLWLVIDKDDHDLNVIFSAADMRKYLFADSNPCFELWLIMHCKALHQLPGLEGSAAVGGCSKVIEELRKHIEPNFQKTKYNVSAHVGRCEIAIVNAKNSDKFKNETWMNFIGSRVYKLAQSIIDSSSHNPSN